ncbi:MAG: type I 3-dehydroquinate dehydratase [Phycisphaerales bacterium]|nr:type I 3-dehydroquinate dehydratase [Phycisphaerales bacterium]
MATLLCVPIMVRSVESAHADAVVAREHGADLVEYRVDELFHGSEDEPLILRLVESSPLPCILTCRPTWEGGLYDGEDAARIALFERLGTADRPPRYLDVERAAYTRSANLRQKVNLAVEHPKQQRDLRTTLILSTHDFAGRPADLTRRMLAMGAEPAAGVHKVAFRARSLRDNLELFDLLAERTKPTIALGMGEFGLASRVLAPKFGGFLTFASLRPEETTAPGQPTLTDLLGTYRFREIGPATRVYGIVGWPVGHSMSPLVHNAGFSEVGHDGVYVPLPIASHEPGQGAAADAEATYASFKATMLELIHHPRLDFAGCSVTMPHKQNLVRLAREQGWSLDEASAQSRTANTLCIERSGDGSVAQASVANTDAAAALACLVGELGGLAGRRIGVLGAGGVARAIVFGLAGAGASVEIFNRSRPRAEAIAQDVSEAIPGVGPVGVEDWEARIGAEAEAFINCTSVGMTGGPAPDESPLPPDALARGNKLVMETVYHPVRTKLLSEAQDAGWRTIDGVEMFVGQGARQFELWTGVPAPCTLFRRLVREALQG